MKKSIRKIFSLLLALVMVFSLLPAQALAEEPEGAIAPVEDPTPPEDGGQSDQENAPDAEVEGSIAPAPGAEIQAASGSCGTNLTWTLTDDGTLTISGTGSMTSYTSSTGMPWNSYKSQIKTLMVESGVTSIGNYAFYGCTKLTAISLPDGLGSVGQNAFRGCTGLQEAILPDTVTKITSGAFYGCTALMTVQMPVSLSDWGLGSSAFYGCTKLAAINIPSGLKHIESQTFQNCKALAYVTLPDTLLTVGNSAFSGCSALEEIAIPSSVTTVSGSAFKNCTALAQVTLSESLTTIDSSTFSGCSALTAIVIPSSVTTINGSAFGNTGLTAITFLGSAPTIASTAFTGVTADAYYPGDNDTWTADKMQDYGGTLTWHAVGAPIVSPYGLIIAGIPVTDDNKDDVLGDGVFRYDSAAAALHISGTAEYSYGGDLIRNTGGALTISTDGGTANLLAPLGEGSSMIYSTGNLSFSGGSSLILNGSEDNNTFRAGTCGVRLEGANYMSVNTAASIRVYRVEKGFLADGHTDLRAYGCDLYANSSAAGFSGFTTHGVIIGSSWRTPANAVFNGSVYESDGTTLAREVSLHVIEYDLTIAGKQLDYNTANGFLGDLMYRYDPTANVLHLQGSYTIPTDYAYSYLISNSIPGLTIQLDYNVWLGTQLNSGQDITFISSGKDLTITGDYPLSIAGSGGSSCTGIYCSAALTLDHVQLFMHRDLAYGLDGSLYFTASLNIVESEIDIQADTAAVFRFPVGINLTDCCFIRPFSPRIESGIVYATAGSAYAKRVTIGVGPYPIGIDGVTITEGNKNDVLGNGVFSFDSDSFTLTVKGSYAGRENAPLIDNYIDGLTIVAASPDCCLSMTSTASNLFGVLVSSGDVTIMPADATCSLTLRDSGGTGRAGIFMKESSTLTVRDLSLKVESLGYGLLGSAYAAASLVLDGASLDTTDHVVNAGIQGFSGGVSLQNCRFVAPAYPEIVDGSVKIDTWQSNGVDTYQYVPAVKTAPADQVYDLVVDGTRVWAGNAADVLGNGVFSYDADVRTLSLSGSYSQPVGSLDMLGTYRIRPVIDSSIDGLTIILTDDATLSAGLENYNSVTPVIRSAGDLTIKGTDSLDYPVLDLRREDHGSYDGVRIFSGSLVLQNLDLRIRTAGTYGLRGENSSSLNIIDSMVEIWDCSDAAISRFERGVILSRCELQTPTGVQFINGTACESGGAHAKSVKIVLADYDIWVGETKVSSYNKDDILGDGTASFDPATKTLSFSTSTPNITGLYTWEVTSGGSTTLFTALIYAESMDLSINVPGSGLTLNSDEACGVYVKDGGISIGGDVRIETRSYALYADGGPVTVDGSADLTTKSDFPVYCEDGDITITGDLTAKTTCYGAVIDANIGNISVGGNVEAVGLSPGTYGLRAGEGISIGGDARIETNSYALYARGGSVIVDGDADLTTGSEGYTVYSKSGDIRIAGDLTVKTDALYIVRTDAGSICIGGSVDAVNTRADGYCGLYASKDISIGGDATIVVNSYPLYALGTITVGSGVWDITANDTAIYAAKGIEIPRTHSITTPTDGMVMQLRTAYGTPYYAVTEADGVTEASHVVIEPKTVGDINLDGAVNALDLLVLRKYLVELPIEGTFDEDAADLNGDGTIDILDLVRLRKVLAG